MRISSTGNIRTRRDTGSRDGIEEQVAHLRHATAEHNQVGMQCDDHVGDADAQGLVAWRMASRTASSPSATACAISRGVTRAASPSTRSYSRGARPHAISQTPCAVIAGPLANVSRHLRFPQPHSGPSGRMV